MPDDFSGSSLNQFAERLGSDWRALALELEIPLHDQETWHQGFEAYGIVNWLRRRGLLRHLLAALIAIDRSDLALLFASPEPDVRPVADTAGEDIDTALESSILLPLNEHPHIAIHPISPPGLWRGFLDLYAPALHEYLTRQGSFPTPAEGAELRQFLGDVRAGILDDIREKIYLPLRAKNAPVAALVDKESSNGGFTPIHQIIRAIAGTSNGGDAASAQIAAVNRRSRLVRNILRELQRAKEPLVLLGDPGTGKTMTLQKVILEIINAEIGRVFPIVPIYIRLGEFHVKGSVTVDDVRDYVRRSVPAEIGARIESLQRSRRLIIVFDGMDEMSRDRYNEHTRALSLFADSVAVYATKTLFSCRITDFSPKFTHRRLVLLPFDRSQIKAYLRTYLRVFPIEIDGDSWSLNRLARRLSQGELPMQASNPFVLWLFCFQVTRTRKWPSSRVDLLQFYIQETYEEKATQAADDGNQLLGLEQLMIELSRLAFLITSRNRGSTISIAELPVETWTAVARESLLRAGRMCRILVVSSKGDEVFVRFEHHRFQEFFTAFHIHREQLPLSWLDKLDAPRWQETMLNLVLMGGGKEPLEKLRESIANLLLKHGKLVAADAVETSSEKTVIPNAAPSVNLPPDSKVERPRDERQEVESALADRIELASRIVRQCKEAQPDAIQIISGTLKPAIKQLADTGSPITQVKMIRACQNLTDLDLLGVLQTPLESNIQWVRGQALILSASSAASARAVGADPATIMAFDLANGLFFSRLKTYVRVLKNGGPGVRWCFVAGLMSALLELVLYYSVSATLYWILTLAIPWLVSPVWIGIYAGIVALATAIALRFEPGTLWAAILWASAMSLILPLMAIGLWSTRLIAELFLFAMVVGFGGYVLFGLVSIVAALIFGLSISSYLMMTWMHRSQQRSTTAVYLAGWKNRGFEAIEAESEIFSRSALAVSVIIGGPIAVFVMIMALQLCYPFLVMAIELCGPTLWWAFEVCFNASLAAGSTLWQFGNLIPLPFTPWGNLIASAVLTYMVVALVTRKWQMITVPVVAGCMLVAYGTIHALGYAAVIICVGVFVLFVIPYVMSFDQLAVAAYVAKFVVVLLCLIGLAAMLMLLWTLGLEVSQRFYARWLLWARSLGPRKWVAEIQKAKPPLQAFLLRVVDQESLGITADEYLDLLCLLAVSITDDPASSVYWELRDRIEQVLKQERLG